ncbi:hypothetical protein Ccrd_022294 [Cynara cardunculus var. scolymus]|uniref:Uncharacterized protein n=1 Tax=Cynara cardunculus var. scolymus TaxID=59895 RepID=A0A118JZ39_CYNCS|nr:hypothetical protein Ccrd_022294 [Cynara cardunculus var. scolymus]
MEDSKDDDDFEIQDQNIKKKVKRVKEDTKGREDNGKGTIKTHLPLRTRTSPKPLYTMIQNLSPSQIECVKEMGFEGMLNMKTDGIPAKLGYYVVDSFNSKNMMIKLENGVIPVTVKKIHEMIGAPIGGAQLDSLVNDNCGVSAVEQWKSRYSKPSLRVTDIVSEIIISDNGDWNFKLDFIMVFCNVMGQCKSNGICDLSVLSYISQQTFFEKINWCDYIFKCLR